MLTTPVRKNKINLADYNYRKDIENRILMSQLSVFEVDLLREMISGSLRVDVEDLAQTLDCNQAEVGKALDKLAPSKLFKVQGSTILVDKEMRKYYEFQIEKFSEDFKPNIEFIQSSLNKVPIHVLPSWYSIPRTSDHIFSSIIENYLLTPKMYLKYLEELQFDQPVLSKIMKEVFDSPELSVSSKEIKKKYELTRAEFEELMLHLEYNFVCFLCYKQVDGMWEETITPFFEWKEYIVHLKKTHIIPLDPTAKIQQKKETPFHFVEDMNAVLKVLLNLGTLAFTEKNKKLHLCDEANKAVFDFIKEDQIERADYIVLHLKKLENLGLAESKTDSQKIIFEATEESKNWLKRHIQEQAIILYRKDFHDLLENRDPLYSERSIRAAEKSLKRVIQSGWITFDDFLKGLRAPIGEVEPVALKAKGKQWRYALPHYSNKEINFMEETIFGRLFQAGMVSIGVYEGKRCFCVTPFGRIALGD